VFIRGTLSIVKYKNAKIQRETLLNDSSAMIVIRVDFVWLVCTRYNLPNALVFKSLSTSSLRSWIARKFWHVL